MKKLLLLSAAALALAVSDKAHAQIGGGVVTCLNCVTPPFELPQWLQNFENQVQMIQYQINFWNTLIQNTVDLPEKLFADITGTISQLQAAVQQADLLAERQRFFVDHLSDPSGFGGDLTNIPAMLAQENNALAYAMQTMSQVLGLSQQMQTFYAPQIAAIQAIAPGGITQAVQIGNQMTATAAQQQAVYMNAQTVAFQAMATAELRKAHRETLLDSRALLDQENAVATECSYIVNFSPPACSAPMPPVPGGSAGTVANGGTGVAPAAQPTTSYVTTAGG